MRKTFPSTLIFFVKLSNNIVLQNHKLMVTKNPQTEEESHQKIKNIFTFLNSWKLDGKKTPKYFKEDSNKLYIPY